MHIRSIRWTAAVLASAVTVLSTAAVASAAALPGQGGGGQHSRIRHVLLISVDGLHQQDLAWYVKNFPHSTLAALDRQTDSTTAGRTTWASRPSSG